MANYLQTGLTLDGDGSTFEMAVDGSVTPKAFEAVCPAGILWDLYCIKLILVDNSIQANRFLGQATLTNGIKMEIIAPDGVTVLRDILASTLAGAVVKDTADFMKGVGTTYDLFETSGGGSDDMLLVHVEANRMNGSLPLATFVPGGRFRITIQDNLSTVTHFHAKVGCDQRPLKAGGGP